jgi:hypothetical protein
MERQKKLQWGLVGYKTDQLVQNLTSHKYNPLVVLQEHTYTHPYLRCIRRHNNILFDNQAERQRLPLLIELQ